MNQIIENPETQWPELTEELIKKLKCWIKEHNLPEISTEQLAIFGHSCYWDETDTINCMKVYYKQRANIPEFFANRDPKSESLQFSLKTLQFMTLPKTDKNGNIIILHRLSDTTASNYIFNDGIKLLIMTLDMSLKLNGCKPGYIFLFDMKGVGISHLTRLSITSIRNFFEYLQEGLPVRLKGIHVVNTVWFMSKVISLIRPFMKKELFELLHLYSGDISQIYDEIPPECLPKDFGGELDDLKTLHEKHCQSLYKHRDYFLEEERLYRSYKE